jgi:hypothetical protein
MKSIFAHYYDMSGKEYESLWDKAIFILDTGILLNLYKLPDDAREDLVKILKKTQERLWIPFQVALEFQENRLGVISERKKMYGRVKEAINNVSEKQSIKKLDDIIGKFMNELNIMENKEVDVHEGDELRDVVDSLLEGRVGVPPGSQEELDEIYKEGEDRYKLLRPPGFEDANKRNDKEKKAYFYNNMVIKREFGDLIIWKQIIKRAKQAKLKNIIFITEDKKKDWWEVVEKKTIGPRRELIDEIKSVANVSSFHMYNLARFMKYAAEYFGVKLAKDSINQVKETSDLGIKFEEHAPLHFPPQYIQPRYSVLGQGQEGTTFFAPPGVTPSSYVLVGGEPTPLFGYRRPTVREFTDVSGKSALESAYEALVRDSKEKNKDEKDESGT